MTNQSRSVQQITAVETGLSDFHKMVITILKPHFLSKDGHPELTIVITRTSGIFILRSDFYVISN